MTIEGNQRKYWTTTFQSLYDEAANSAPVRERFTSGRYGFPCKPLYDGAVYKDLPTKIGDFFNWHVKAAENDLKKVEEYQHQSFALSEFHRSLPKDLEITCISNSIQTVLGKVKTIDMARLGEAVNSRRIKFLCLTGCVGLIIHHRIAAIAFLFAGAIGFYNWARFGKNEETIKTLYEEIQKEAARILHVLSYYDEKMHVSTAQVNFERPPIDVALLPPTEELVNSLTYETITLQNQPENLSSKHFGNCIPQ